MAKYTFWVGWEADDNIPDKDIAASWPKGMKGWVSGYGGFGDDDTSFRTWCGRVDADTAQEAERIVRSMYGKHAKKIRMRWEPRQEKLGYRDTTGRFPE